MWMIRQISMLALAVALLLPAGFGRDCCCTRRATIEKSQALPVRPCCQARLAAAARMAKSVMTTKPTLKYPPCRCRATSTTLALLGSKPRDNIVSSWPFDLSPTWIDTFDRMELVSQTEGKSRQSQHQLGPPLRKTLCRWMI